MTKHLMYGLACAMNQNIEATVTMIRSQAEKIGVDAGTITSWFRGKADPRLSLFEAALNAHGKKLAIIDDEETIGEGFEAAVNNLIRKIDEDVEINHRVTSNATIAAASGIRGMIQREKEKRDG